MLWLRKLTGIRLGVLYIYMNQFLNHTQNIKGNKERTTAGYGRYLYKFMQHAGIKDSSEVTIQQVESFISDMVEAKYNKKTVNYMLIAIRSWLEYDAIHTTKPVMNYKLINFLKVPKRKLDIPVEDIRPKIAELFLGVRDRALVDLFLTTGLRVAELRSIKIEDIDMDGGRLTIVGKGDKVRLIPLSKKAKEAIQKQIENGHIRKNGSGDGVKRDKGYLFGGYSHGKEEAMSAVHIQRIITRIGNEIGVRLHPHMLRHIFATNLMKGGAPIEFVKKMLGHSSVTTTEIYLHTTDKELEEDFQKYVA